MIITDENLRNGSRARRTPKHFIPFGATHADIELFKISALARQKLFGACAKGAGELRINMNFGGHENRDGIASLRCQASVSSIIHEVFGSLSSFPAQHSGPAEYLNPLGAALLQRFYAGIGRRAAGQDIVDQQYMSAV
jgi:hypothetical protein